MTRMNLIYTLGLVVSLTGALLGASLATAAEKSRWPGTKAGQELALALLSFVGTLVVVGYGTDQTQYMLSRLMAFDAEIIGTWGCPPKYYADVLRMCIEGKIALEPFVEVRPLSQIEKVLHDAHHGQLSKRVILTPDF